MPRTVCTVDIVLLEALFNKYINSKNIKLGYSYIPIHDEWVLFVSGLTSVNISVNPSKIGKMDEMKELAEKLGKKYLEHFKGK